VRTSRVREAAVHGSFYPGDPEVLRVTVDKLLADAPSPPEEMPVPRAVIVPRAGYVYSGFIAATACVGPETLVVISSDLSHYLPYEQARRVDARTIAQISSPDRPLEHTQECGATAVNGLLVAARRHSLRPVLLGACNSGDTAGDRSPAVGHCAFAFEGEDDA
jgi:predicted class III extradiol MEMO1 family dioxygenase